jgi:FixJ family two-component response regulator
MLLLTDVVLPGRMDGPHLAKEARRINPDLKVIYMSGYTENAIVHHGRLDPGVDLLQKPFRRRDVAAKVRAALDQEIVQLSERNKP